MSDLQAYQQVTIRVFSNPFEANLAQAALETEGIESWLEGDHLAQTAWHLTNALGGVKLQVAASFEEEAVRVLNELQTKRELKQIEEEPESTNKIESVEEKINRAFKLSLYGLITLPVILHIYSLFVLLCVSSDEVHEISPSTKKRLRIAYGINFVSLIIPAWIVFAVMSRMID